MPDSVKRLLAGAERKTIWGEDGQFDRVEDVWSLPATITDAEKAECRKALAAVDRHLARANETMLAGRVASALAHYYVPDVPASVQAAVAEDWFRQVGEFPDWAIQMAFSRWLGMERRRPTIADIRDLCQRAVRQWRRRQERLRKIVDAHCADVRGADVVPMPALRRMDDPQ
ncbi:hypothetical protein VPG91_11565 [Nitrospirillum amazonense]|uniref:hypothetical protein n=1 Tax=Nitrospirillum amazonense TaxID=28077 RepID=UPI002DD4503D|nr:hypothetical protein [Nitrospirillum amazonense]MEC4591627.1 hypothetical protein [Nitrospirillum amazonense]